MPLFHRLFGLVVWSSTLALFIPVRYTLRFCIISLHTGWLLPTCFKWNLIVIIYLTISRCGYDPRTRQWWCNWSWGCWRGRGCIRITGYCRLRYTLLSWITWLPYSIVLLILNSCSGISSSLRRRQRLYLSNRLLIRLSKLVMRILVVNSFLMLCFSTGIWMM